MGEREKQSQAIIHEDLRGEYRSLTRIHLPGCHQHHHLERHGRHGRRRLFISSPLVLFVDQILFKGKTPTNVPKQ